MDKGNALVGYQPLGNIPNFFRMILSNMASTTDDVNQLLDEIAEFGEM
jgi:glutamate decarboxylase